MAKTASASKSKPADTASPALIVQGVTATGDVSLELALSDGTSAVVMACGAGGFAENMKLRATLLDALGNTVALLPPSKRA